MNWAADTRRYNRALIAIHWLTALLMFCIISIGLTMTALPRTSPVRETWFTVHKSIGLIILGLVTLRVIVRTASRAPVIPGRSAGWSTSRRQSCKSCYMSSWCGCA
jgi:cytochrome b561